MTDDLQRAVDAARRCILGHPMSRQEAEDIVRVLISTRDDVIEQAAKALDVDAEVWEVNDDGDYAAAMRRAAMLVRSLKSSTSL